jgi:hypothetical protein
MLREASSEELRKIRTMLLDTFQHGHAEKLRRKLTDPSGGVGQTSIWWLAKEQLWAHFSDTPQVNGSRWFCWFGKEPSGEGSALTPDVEINLALNNSRQAAGRGLADSEGNFYLGHKGMLGGGRGGQMSMEIFGRNIEGFVREPILRPDLTEEGVFVIGRIGSPDFVSSLSSYVSECRRLRALAKSRPPSAESDGDFSPENEQEGRGKGAPSTPAVIRKEHARVVNALQKTIGRKSTNSARFEMRPDLYLSDKNGSMSVLFEVKVSSGTQSWFTAIGQLLVYGSREKCPPQRVLVAPSPRQDPAFAAVLTAHKIKLVTYKEDEQGFRFFGLEQITFP